MKKDIITVKESSEGMIFMLLLFLCGVVLIGSFMSYGADGNDIMGIVGIIIIGLLFGLLPLLMIIRTWNWHLYVYEDDSLRFINWRGKITNFQVRDIKEIEKKYRYHWNWLAGPNVQLITLKIKDLSNRCLCSFDHTMEGYNQFEVWMEEKDIPIRIIEKDPMEKRANKKYYFGQDEVPVATEVDPKILKRLRVTSILLPIGYVIMYIYWLFTWRDITWIHIIYSMVIYILCVVYHEYTSAETPLFLNKTKYQEWRKKHANFSVAMLISGYFVTIAADSWAGYYIVIKGSSVLLSVLLFLFMAIIYLYVAKKDGYVNHIVMVLFLLYFCGTISKPFLLTFLDDASPKAGYGIVVEKQEERGDDWLVEHLKVRLDSGKTVKFTVQNSKTYDNCHVDGAIQLYVWDLPFGFEIATLAEGT